MEKPFRRAYGRVLEEDVLTGISPRPSVTFTEDSPNELLQNQDLVQIRSDAHRLSVAVEKLPYVMEANEFERPLTEILSTCETTEARNCDVDRLVDLISRA